MRGYHIRISVQLKAGFNRPSSSTTFTPGSVFVKLPAQTPKPTARRSATFNPRNKDYRFGPIRIDWVDFEMSEKTAGKAREYGRAEPAAATFIPSEGMESGSTNLPEGIIHLFREGSTTSSEDHLKASSSSVKSDSPEFDGVMLGVLAVPSWMAPSDFLAFVAPAAEGITHLRIIRDSVPNRSIVVIKFSDPDHASEFAEAYNGKPFNSMEPEICHVVRVLSVNMDAEDPALSRLVSTQALYELPTCPVCLERMDSAVTGLITVPCSHTFHCMCLSKWGDSRCPVCRYSQTLMSSHPSVSSSTRSIPFANPSAPTLSACSACQSTTNLWICLICGNIGCGRYGRAHAQAHYQTTTHLYALELETQRVWDYAGDGYVHRLIQNKADGKLVELPSASSSMGTNPRDGGLGPGPSDALSAEKIEAIGIEYSYLLTSQLDSQRAYYEEQTNELHSQVGELRSILERLSGEYERDKAAAKEEVAQRRQDEDERMASLAKDKAKAESRAEKVTDLARRLEKELNTERANEVPDIVESKFPLWLTAGACSILLALAFLWQRLCKSRAGWMKDLDNLGQPRVRKLSGSAIVCGGSIAGIVTARILADHFERVLVIDPEIQDVDKPKTRVIQYHAVHGESYLDDLLKTITTSSSALMSLFVEGARRLWPDFDTGICGCWGPIGTRRL
ncbi:RING finger protein ETP1 [Mycena venus]|uniref:RING finger protein ETP1 n=1 Tax=Mycena venus TaxID=2733690 RepID=A0A8H6YE65_9AGAR|nr:RING finger protein ETP1 [Mycena venus]